MSVDRSPIYLDATKLSKLLGCRRAFDFAHADHIKPVGPRDALSLGITIHDCVEVWNNKPDSIPHDIALGAMIQYTLAQAKANGLSHAADAKDSRRSIESAAMAMFAFAERHTPDYKTHMIDGRPAQELHFTFPTGRMVGSREIVLCGYIDRVVVDPLGNIFGLDYKSTLAALTTYWAESFASSVQMNVYMWAIHRLGIKPKGLMIQGIQPLVSGIRLQSMPVIGGSRKLVDERIDGILTQAIAMLSLPARTPNPNHCHGQYTCEFWKACNAYGTHREAILASDYEPTPIWAPEIIRQPNGEWNPNATTSLDALGYAQKKEPT